MNYNLITIESKEIFGKYYISVEKDNVWDKVLKSGIEDVEKEYPTISESDLDGIETLLERPRTLGINLTQREANLIKRLHVKDKGDGNWVRGDWVQTIVLDFSKDAFTIILKVV